MMTLALIPAIPFLASVMGFLLANHRQWAIQVTTYSIPVTLLCAIVIFVTQQPGNHIVYQFLAIGHINLTVNLHLSTLSFVMLLLITFMSMVVHLYAARYMLSDVTQPRFMAQLSLVTASVIFLVMSENMLAAFLGWQWIGLSLYLLLNHYQFDTKANKAAKKKFIINRLGDVCFLFAIIIAYQNFYTSSIMQLTQMYDMYYTILGIDISAKGLIAGLVFIAVMTKSAQFPFHIWLPDTMETPTPVSALMHAGVINSGGYLLTSLSPLITTSTTVMTVIFIVGLTTAIIAIVFMLTQADIKKQLAYSTMGQMGYMIMQCGLGCFSAAVFHLIAHGFYKASLFLNAGNALKTTAAPNAPQPNRFARAMLAYITAIVILVFGLFGLPFKPEINILLTAFVFISIAQFLWHSSQPKKLLHYMFSSMSIAFIYITYLCSLKYLDVTLSNIIIDSTNIISNPVQYVIVSVLIASQLMIWTMPPIFKASSNLGKHLYVASLNKFYVERFYRVTLLYPLRHLGDIGNSLIIPNIKRSIISVLDITLIFVFSANVYGLIAWYANSNYHNLYLLTANLCIFLCLLITSNRTKSFKVLFLFICAIQLAFINIGLYLSDEATSAISVFHQINIATILIPLIFLFDAKKNKSITIKLGKNELPWLSIYTSIILLLLIGIPGTAGFISEFVILYFLSQFSILLACLYGAGIILTSIVVLHLLQVYIFNPSKISRYDPKLPIALHVTCIFAIAVNIFNGLHPNALLKLLA